jgi:hypothetical protein
MQKGDVVKKKSGKPFQNKEKIAAISEITTMGIPLAKPQVGIKTVNAVLLEGCKGPVRIEMIEVIEKEECYD